MAKGEYVEAKAGSTAASEPAVKEATSDKENRGELESISIRMAENGFTVTCSYEPKKRGPNTVYPSSPSYVFEEIGSALAYIGKKLVEGAEAEGKEK